MGRRPSQPAKEMPVSSGGAAATVEIVGRDEELRAISSFLEQRPARGALLIEGEPGIGKTTLWRAAVDAAVAQRLASVLQARPAESEQKLSFSALGDLLGPVVDRLDELAAPRRRALEIALLLDSDAEAAPDARAVALATLDLLRLAGCGCCSCSSRSMTRSGSTRPRARRWCTRSAGSTATRSRCWPPTAPVVPSSRAIQRSVSSSARCRSARSACCSGAGQARRMTRPTLVRVHETSGGNPFFALELVRALDGQELHPGEPLPVPATLSALTASRFEGLDPETLEVLLYVAALARPTREVVRAAAGEGANSALETAAAAGVVETDGARLRFTHPLLASIHYGSAPSGDRERVHRRIAAVVTDAEERGRHLGAATTEPDAEVARALDEAATAARARGAPVAAAELGEIALRLTPPSDSESLLRRLCSAADHEFAAGATARARSLLEEALAAAPRGPEHARVALQLATLLDTPRSRRGARTAGRGAARKRTRRRAPGAASRATGDPLRRHRLPRVVSPCARCVRAGGANRRPGTDRRDACLEVRLRLRRRRRDRSGADRPRACARRVALGDPAHEPAELLLRVRADLVRQARAGTIALGAPALARSLRRGSSTSSTSSSSAPTTSCCRRTGSRRPGLPTRLGRSRSRPSATSRSLNAAG